MYDPNPTLRIDIEGVRHSIMHHLGAHTDGISQAIRREIEARLTPENLTRWVAEQVEESLPPLIKGATAAALDRIKWDRDALSLLASAVGAAISKAPTP